MSYKPHYISSWSTSDDKISQCESRHRLIVELENRESEMKAGDKVSVKLHAQDTSGFFNTSFRNASGHKAEIKITSPIGETLIQETISGNREYFYSLPDRGQWEIILSGPGESGSCSLPPIYNIKNLVTISKKQDPLEMGNVLGSIVEFRKGIAALVGIIILGVIVS